MWSGDTPIILPIVLGTRLLLESGGGGVGDSWISLRSLVYPILL